MAAPAPIFNFSKFAFFVELLKRESHLLNCLDACSICRKDNLDKIHAGGDGSTTVPVDEVGERKPPSLQEPMRNSKS